MNQVAIAKLLIKMSFSAASLFCFTDRGATTAEKLRGPRFGSQHGGACGPHPAKGRAGVGAGGVAPSRCGGPGVSHPVDFCKLRC